MSFRLVRIDDRLIHGQVVAGWLRALGAKRIVIVDDATARDEFLREVLTLAAPQGVPVEVLGLAEGAARCLELASTPEPVIVLARSPRTILGFRQAGGAGRTAGAGEHGNPGRDPNRRRRSADSVPVPGFEPMSRPARGPERR